MTRMTGQGATPRCRRLRIGRAGLAALLAIGATLSAAGVQAKHAKSDADEASDSSSSPATRSGQATVIRGELLEAHDRLDPAPYPDITRLHTFTVTLSGKNDVTETWTDSRNFDSKRQSTHRRGGSGKKHLKSLVLQDESDGPIGADSGHVVWHVLGDRKLQRIFQGEHFLMVMDIELTADNACKAEAKYLRQTGFESIVMMRTDIAEPAKFSLPRVKRVSCTIR